jgi:hypothetical protein
MIQELFGKYKVVIFVVGLILIGSVAYGIYLSVTRAGKEPVTVYLTPSDAILTANGERISGGITYLKPGEYIVEASKEGFSPYKSTVTIGAPNTTDIDVALKGESEAAKKWQDEHQELYMAKEGREGTRADEGGKIFTDLNPIATQLPIRTLLYTIGYSLDKTDPSGNSLIIEISAGPGYRLAALQKLRDFGYDPTDFKINFKNYENPFDYE